MQLHSNMKKKLYLHIGVHRTGTTSIQNFLYNNRVNLQKQGVLYPFGLHHNEYKWSLESAERLKAGTTAVENFASKLLKKANKEKLESIILSGEDFCQFERPEILRPLAKLFDVRIICYLRRQDKWLESWYNQHLRWPWDAELSLMSPEQFFARRKDFHWLNYKNLIDSWAGVFGRKNLIVRVFERNQLLGSLENDFCQACDINYESLSLPRKERNISVTPMALEFLRHMRMVDKEPIGRAPLVQSVKSACQRANCDQRDYSFQWTHRRQILDEHAEENAYVAKKYLGSKDGVLFQEVLSNASPLNETPIELPAKLVLVPGMVSMLLLDLLKRIEWNMDGQKRVMELTKEPGCIAVNPEELSKAESWPDSIRNFIRLLDISQYSDHQRKLLYYHLKKCFLIENSNKGNILSDIDFAEISTALLVSEMVDPLVDDMLEVLVELRTSKAKNAREDVFLKREDQFKGPDFLAIGPPKTATTWMYHTLSIHPDIKLPPVKEIRYFWEREFLNSPGYFSRFLSSHWHFYERRKLYRERFACQIKLAIKGRFDYGRFLWDLNFILGRHSDQWYRRLFDTTAVSGDITPKYSELSDRAIEKIRAVLPELKIIISLRNPVEREWSRAKMNLCKRMGRQVEDVPCEEWIAHFDEPGQTFASDYLALYRRWSDIFGTDAVFMFYYDELMDDSWALYQRLCRFLGVSAPGEKLKEHVSQKWQVDIQGDIPVHLRTYLVKKYRQKVEAFSRVFPDHEPPAKWLQDMQVTDVDVTSISP